MANIASNGLKVPDVFYPCRIKSLGAVRPYMSYFKFWVLGYFADRHNHFYRFRYEETIGGFNGRRNER